jgi:hypothetical protein
MNKIFINAMIGICIFFSFGLAHLDKTSLSIKGGESFIAGTKDTITWKLAIIHMKTNFIYFSKDSLSAWQLIDSVSEKSGNYQMSYIWTVPQVTSKNAKIRIFQSVPAKPSETTDDYNLVSKPFSISLSSTAVIMPHKRLVSQAIQSQKTGFAFDPQGRMVGERSLDRMRDRKILSQKLFTPSH